MAINGGVTAEMFQSGITEIKQCLTGISSKITEINYTLQAIERKIGYLENYLWLGFLFLILVIAIAGCAIAYTNTYLIYRNPRHNEEDLALLRSEVRKIIDEEIARALSAKK